ncbi:unnamed protein product [Periconia digitata]|uniref:Uncharacterized protein n=1 Tax=Periconia digitata TaxID=1303443 RepID=A0A9W4XP82_9PLEO|nr:unnamed protein product [Periconia digitata]
MNWTGGSLQRLRNTNKGTVQKQKAHFARARTRLQSGPRRSSPPVPPSYISNNIPVGKDTPDNSRFGRGHGGTLQHKHSKVSNSLANRSPEVAVHVPSLYGRSRNLHRKSRGNSRPVSETSHERKRKRGKDEQDSSSILLDQRQTLLSQHNWVGLTVSKPAQLRIEPSKEKEMIGKRRKIEDCTHTISNAPGFRRQRTKDDGKLLHMAASLPFEDVVIQFGSDAAKTQPSPAQSQPSSTRDSFATMLFDNDHWRPSGSLVDRRSARGVSQVSQNSIGVLVEHPLRRDETQENRAVSWNEIGSIPPASLDVGCEGEFRNSQTHKLIKHSTTASSQAGALHSHDITQLHEGSTQALRSMVDRTSVSLPSRREYQIGETSHAIAPANAALCEKGKNTQHSMGSIPLIESPQSSDYCLWKSLVPLDDRSSVGSEPDLSKLGEPGHDGIELHRKAPIIIEPESWSQKATQDEETYAGLTQLASTSLPSLTPYSDRRTGLCSEDLSGWGGGLVEEPYYQHEDVDKDEMLWRPYVFGSTDATPCGLNDANVEVAEKEMTAGRRVAACNAVSSLSCSPVRSILKGPKAAGCISDNAQHGAARAPSSTYSGSLLSAMTSPVVVIDGSIMGNRNRKGISRGERLAEHMDSSGQPRMIRSSIQNNVSCSTGASSTSNIGPNV